MENDGATPAGAFVFADSAGIVAGHWPLVGRTAELERLIRAATDKGMAGALMTGEAGVGKSALARAATARLAATHHIINVRGTGLIQRIPYGALGSLLAELPDLNFTSPLGVTLRLVEALRRDAAGRPVLIVVDNVGLLDQQSIAVLLSVVLGGVARIFILARTSADVPEDFHRMLHEGRLAAMAVQPLKADGVAELLAAHLGRSATPAAVLAFYDLTGGNPLFLKSVVAEQLSTGNLYVDGDIWSLVGGVEVTGSSASAVVSRISRCPPRQREILEVVSLSDGVPLRHLVKMYDAADIARLEEDNFLLIDLSGEPVVGFRNRYEAETVRAGVSVIRSRALRNKVVAEAEIDPAAMSSAQRLAFAVWTRDCGLVLQSAHALDAGRTAVELYEPALALQLLEDVQEADPEWIPSGFLRARAHIIEEDHAQALEELDRIGEQRLDAAGSQEYLEYVQLKAAVLQWISDGPEQIPGLYRAARRKLDRELPADRFGADPVRRFISNRLQLRELEYEAYLGHYESLLPPVQALFAEVAGQDRSVVDSELRWSLQALLCESLAVTGRQVDGLALAQDALVHLRSAGLTPAVRSAVMGRIFRTMLLSGLWSRCLELIDESLTGVPAQSRYNGGGVELTRGLLQLGRGNVQDAQQHLASAVAQLRRRPNGNSLSTAYAASALGHAIRGHRGTAASLLARLPDPSGSAAPDGASDPSGSAAPASWYTSSVTALCARTARLYLGEREAIDDLLRSADEDLRAGRRVPAEHSLLMAALAGSDDALARLEDVAALNQGTLSLAAYRLAKGIRSRDVGQLLEAADLARQVGAVSLERCICAEADRMAHTELHDDAAAPAAAGYFRSPIGLAGTVSGPGSGAFSGAAQASTAVLTEREQQVFRLAADGLSNRDIAERLGKSVRTVEGHLYRIYTKLGLTGRAQLRELP